MTDFASPNTGNYIVGKGAVYFTVVGGAERHMGNCAEMEIELEVEELEHFSSQSGTRTKDLTVALEVGATVRIVLEEWTVSNLSMALLGNVSVDTEGRDTIEILAVNLVTGAVRFTGANDVGPKWQVEIPSVSFRPDGPIGLITDEWGQLELLGEVNGSSSFGTFTLLDSTETGYN